MIPLNCLYTCSRFSSRKNGRWESRILRYGIWLDLGHKSICCIRVLARRWEKRLRASTACWNWWWRFPLLSTHVRDSHGFSKNSILKACLNVNLRGPREHSDCSRNLTFLIKKLCLKTRHASAATKRFPRRHSEPLEFNWKMRLEERPTDGPGASDGRSRRPTDAQRFPTDPSESLWPWIAMNDPSKQICTCVRVSHRFVRNLWTSVGRSWASVGRSWGVRRTLLAHHLLSEI